jgi:hypothetical protein
MITFGMMIAQASWNRDTSGIVSVDFTTETTNPYKEIEMNEAQIEQEIKDKGLTAPRLTPEQIDACIRHTEYWQPVGTTVTVCLVTLQNGFNVIGHSAAASPENFDLELGQKIAFKTAREKIWQLEGYLLKQGLYEAQFSTDE